MAAAKAISYWSEQAKERQVVAGKEYGRGKEKVRAPVPQAIGGKATGQAGKKFGVSGRSVADPNMFLIVE